MANTAKRSPLFESQGLQIFAMIDAKRMEVFGAIFNQAQEISLKEQAIELDTTYFENLVRNGPILCIGSGAPKVKNLITHASVLYCDLSYNIMDFIELAESKFALNDFEDTAYTSPAYLKEFYLKTN